MREIKGIDDDILERDLNKEKIKNIIKKISTETRMHNRFKEFN